MTSDHLKEKCDHGHSLYDPNGCQECKAQIWPYKSTDTGDDDGFSDDVHHGVPYGGTRERARRYYLEHPFSVEEAGTKPSNPKDALGIKKVPFTTISWPVLAELGVAMFEGACKYGRHNYRTIGVRASVYIDAANRHMASYWEGEDIDPDSGLSHITKAIASLVVLRDAMINDKFTDDRPPRPPAGWMARLNEAVAALILKYPEPALPYTEVDNTWSEAAQ